MLCKICGFHGGDYEELLQDSGKACGLYLEALSFVIDQVIDYLEWLVVLRVIVRLCAAVASGNGPCRPRKRPDWQLPTPPGHLSPKRP
jgi:hypothetical protein